MNQGTILGSQIGRWVVLAAVVALLGALLLTIRPVGAQTPPTGCDPVGRGEAREYVCNLTYAENGTGPVKNLGALDRDIRQVVKVWELVTDAGDAGDAAVPKDPAYTAGYADYGVFKIDRGTGELSFRSPPDYENPRSTATGSLAERNVYKVQVKVGDGEKYRPAKITVRVTGVEETETLTLSARQPEVGTRIEASLSGGDIYGQRTPDWKWQMQNDGGGWDDIPDAGDYFYTPEDEDVKKKLRAYVEYVDSHGNEKTKLGESGLMGTGITEFPVRAKPDNTNQYESKNHAPEFRENEGTDAGDQQITRRIEENMPPGSKVGPPLFATDDNHLTRREGGGPRDVLTYSLDAEPATANDAAKFNIDQKTGQITTNVMLNYEKASSPTEADACSAKADDGTCTVTVVVKATDPSGATGMATVTIHVLDVAETPEVRGPAALTYFENQTEADASLILFRDPTRADPEEGLPHEPTPAETGNFNKAVFTAFDSDLDDDDDSLAARDIEWQITGPDSGKFQFETMVTPIPTFYASSGVPSGLPLVVAASPVLRWRGAPDLEAEADLGGTKGDNVYEITVSAWDEDWEIGSRQVNIRLANSNDAGKVTLSHIQPQVGTKLTATPSDQDGITEEITWRWYRGQQTGDAAVLEVLTECTAASEDCRIAGATSNAYTPVNVDGGLNDEGRTLTAVATYTDRSGTAEMASAATVNTNPVQAKSVSNQAPKFYKNGIVLVQGGDTTAETAEANRDDANNETGRYVRHVLENSEARFVTLTELDARVYDTDTTDTEPDDPITGVVNVYDTADRTPEDDNPIADGTNGNQYLHYSLSGPGAKYFTIDNKTDEAAPSADPPTRQYVRGLIRTKGPLDHEANGTYTVTVTATDPGGKADTATVTIHVADVPELEGLEERIRVPENTKSIANPSAVNPTEAHLGGIKWSLLLEEPDTETDHNRTVLTASTVRRTRKTSLRGVPRVCATTSGSPTSTARTPSCSSAWARVATTTRPITRTRKTWASTRKSGTTSTRSRCGLHSPR